MELTTLSQGRQINRNMEDGDNRKNAAVNGQRIRKQDETA